MNIYAYLDLLAVVGKANLTLLDSINFDHKELEKAQTLADDMLHSRAVMNIDPKGYDEKLKRDQMFFLLKTMIGKIREYGKFVFQSNADRLKGYCSSYVKRKNDKANK